VAERDEWAKAHFLFAPNSAGVSENARTRSLTTTRPMALQIETIRATADRVAASHGLEVVDVEFTGGGKHRALRVFVEKDAEGRAKLAQEAAKEDSQLPKGVPIESLSGTTHEDCEAFARDFGTVLDVEDLVPGAEYTLEVSSPGLERKLRGAADYERFRGSLVKVQTFAPVEGNRHFTGRLTAFDGTNLTLDLAAVKQKGKAKKAAATTQTAEISLGNIEKASLVAEI
jgi:ribosome maturation factor RimP